MMRYITQQLAYEHPLTGLSDAVAAHESAQAWYGPTFTPQQLTHAVIDTTEHPLRKTVCYATRSNAEAIANSLNSSEPVAK